MKRKMRVLQIKGFRGLFFLLFCICCLFAGFVIFPGVLAMGIWNYLAYQTGSFSSISIYGGTLLWAIVVMSFLVTRKKHIGISFSMPKELTETEVKDVLSRIKKQSDVSTVIFPDENVKVNDDSKELSSVVSEKNDDKT